ncbi:MAG: hypothetical protein ACE5FC_02765 [Myxococcota bacterium]
MATLPSRNQAFALYQRPGARRALNAHRLLEAIRRDLARPRLRDTLRIRAIRMGRQQRYRLEYDDTALRCARTTYLTRGELDQLREMLGPGNGRYRLKVEEDSA